MNLSTRKLFSSAQNNNIHYAIADLIEIPSNKNISDIATYFQLACTQDSQITNTCESFDSFIMGYFQAIDFKLKEFTKIQRKISAQGITDVLFSQFEKESNTRKSHDMLYSEFDLLSHQSDNLVWLSFLKGYQMAEQKVHQIAQFIQSEQVGRNLSKSSVYTNFWDFVAVERIDPNDIAVGVAIH